jgi:excinuclease ABC subunit A
MPWESNGRRWHTIDRVSRQGTACRWDGRILAEVVDRIQSLGAFGETNWNHRSIVEIASAKKSDGWFLHAGTGEEWLLKLKFHTAKNTFNRDTLIADLALKPLNDLPDLPVYGYEPRVKVKNTPGPWQEIQLQVYTFAEIDRPEFWKFLERAVAGFQQVSDRMRQNPDDVMPWKVLGQKWHFARKGFPPGRPPQWEIDALEELCEILQSIAPHGQMLWNNQQVVHMFVGEQREPWASLWTKRSASLELTLTGPHGHFALGKIAELGLERDFAPGKSLDVVKLRFRTAEDLERGELREFIREHLATLATSKRQAVG